MYFKFIDKVKEIISALMYAETLFIFTLCLAVFLVFVLIKFLLRLGHMANVLLGNVQQQGSWGENILYRTLDHGGFRANIDYLRQPVYESRQGSLRPDCIIIMPGGKKLIVDAKVCLVASSRHSHKKHAQSIKKQIKLLKGKQYPMCIDNSVDKIVMFLPTDVMLSSALSADNNLISYALKLDIILATPATLMSTLLILEKFYCQKNISDEQKRITKEFKLMAANMNSLMTTLNKISKDVSSFQKQYDNLTNK